jgi:hypothetical protein
VFFRRDPHRGLKAELATELRNQFQRARRHRWVTPNQVTLESIFGWLQRVGNRAIDADSALPLRGVIDVAAAYADPLLAPPTIRGILARCAGAWDALRSNRNAAESAAFRLATVPLLMFWEARQLTEQAFGLGSVRTPDPAPDTELTRQVLPVLRQAGLLTPGEHPISMAASVLAGESTLWVFSDRSLYVMRREQTAVAGLPYSPDLAVWAEPGGGEDVQAEAYDRGRFVARGRFLSPPQEWRDLVAAVEVMACQRYVVGVTELI